MKKYSFLLLIIVFKISLLKSEQKIACLKSSEVVQKMPEFISAEKKLRNLTEIHNNEFQKIIKIIQEKSNQYEKEVHLKNIIENKKRIQELIYFKKKAEEYQKIANEELNKTQNNTLDPIYKKIENAIIKIVEKNKSITRVDDCSPGRGILFNKGLDITKEVLDELGLK